MNNARHIRVSSKCWQRVLLAAGLAASCGGDHRFLGWGSGGEHAQGGANVGGSVVSTVDGVPITIAEVEALANATGLSARAALTRLQSQALLIGEAEHRGYGRNAEVERVARQARVQALLAHDVETVHASSEEIAGAYQKQRARFHTPERRGSLHILAALPAQATPEQEAAARKFAEEAIRALSLVDDPNGVAEEFAQRSSPLFTVRMEHLPEIANDGSFVETFSRGLFSTSKVGVVPEPIRSEYGVHAIYVTSIKPARDVTLEEATPDLRAELDLEKQKQKLADVLASLRTEVRVEIERKNDRAIGELDLWAR